MALSLGKTLNRSYNLRLSFMSGYYDIGIFFNIRSVFLLFNVKPDFSKEGEDHKRNININMFKNLDSSKFCETFLDLHNYRSKNLDIINQFNNIKPDYYQDISFISNETLTLSKVEINNKFLFDCVNIYIFTMNAYVNEFIFLLAERQNIVRKLNKKIVRTTAIQISTKPALEILDNFHQEKLNLKKIEKHQIEKSKETIKLSEVENNVK